jgi:hypothetical protein
MSTHLRQYETVLSEYSNPPVVIELLKQHRPYLEMVPSLRRPNQSVIPLPLPVAKVRQSQATQESGTRSSIHAQVKQLPCDVAILMCDPEWKIKTGAEIFVFIHRPDEDFSGLLSRWRQTQVMLSHNYEWLMPYQHRHIISEGSDDIFPLFVLFSSSPDRLRKGLTGAGLPFILFESDVDLPELAEPPLSSESLEA